MCNMVLILFQLKWKRKIFTGIMRDYSIFIFPNSYLLKYWVLTSVIVSLSQVPFPFSTVYSDYMSSFSFMYCFAKATGLFKTYKFRNIILKVCFVGYKFTYHFYSLHTSELCTLMNVI